MQIYLPRYCFAAYAENCTLPRCKEVYGSRLPWVAWIMDLIFRYFIYIIYILRDVSLIVTCWAMSKL